MSKKRNIEDVSIKVTILGNDVLIINGVMINDLKDLCYSIIAGFEVETINNIQVDELFGEVDELYPYKCKPFLLDSLKNIENNNVFEVITGKAIEIIEKNKDK